MWVLFENYLDTFYSGFQQDPCTSAAASEPLHEPEVKVIQDSPNHLHRLVSEGNLIGVRLVHVVGPQILT